MEPDALFVALHAAYLQARRHKRGTPSQLFANIYLNPLDQFVKRELKLRWYGRYVDDMVFLHPDRAVLRDYSQNANLNPSPSPSTNPNRKLEQARLRSYRGLLSHHNCRRLAREIHLNGSEDGRMQGGKGLS